MQIQRSIAALLFAVGALTSAHAQEAPSLSLPRAVTIALEKNPAHKMALAEVEISNARLGLARTSFLPRVDFIEALTRSNDPVYAFGTKLRQGRFTAADFQLSSLNHPDALGNFSSRLGGSWTVFDSMQNTYQMRSARAMNVSAQQRMSRADQELIYRVIQAYYGYLLANKNREVMEQTVTTAQSVVDSTAARVEAGTAVEADSLSAKVTLASRQQELIRARSAVNMARTDFEIALGIKLLPGQLPADSLQERHLPVSALEEVERRALLQRPDLLAISSQLGAQQNSVKAARAALGPRLDVFGSWEADNQNLAANGSSNWATGIELRIDLFARDKNAHLAVERATLSRGEAARQIAEDNARLDIRRSYYEHDAARQMLEVARGTVAQADESLRIMRDRYDSGLVTITDLLRAEDAARNSRMRYWQSVYEYSITYAAVQLASGDLSAQNPVVSQ